MVSSSVSDFIQSTQCIKAPKVSRTSLVRKRLRICETEILVLSFISKTYGMIHVMVLYNQLYILKGKTSKNASK